MEDKHNRVQNGGFEQSDPNTFDVGPFWTSTGDFTMIRGPQYENQLLGNNCVLLAVTVDPDEEVSSISQQLLPLQVGKYYELNMSVAASGPMETEGTLDVAIDGTPLRSFQVSNIVILGAYVQYSFPFQATVADATLTITNNSTKSILIDVVSVFQK